MKAKLEEVREWAKSKIASGAEPPWSWYQLMKLIEAVDTILEGQACITTENSQRVEARPGKHLRPVDSTYPRDSVQLHQPEKPLPLPM